MDQKGRRQKLAFELGNVNGGYNVDKEPDTETVVPLRLALSVVTPVKNPLEEIVKLNVGNGGGNTDPVIIVALALPLIDTVVGKGGPETVEAVPVVKERELYPAEPADAPVPVEVPLVMVDEFPKGKGKGADCEAVPAPEVTPLDGTLRETEGVPLDEETVPGRAEVERVSPLDAGTGPPVGNGSAVELPPGYGGETKLEGGLDPVTLPVEMATVREPEETVPKLEVTGILPKAELLELPSEYEAEDEVAVVPDGGLELRVPERLIVDRDPELVKTEKVPEANGAMEEPVGLIDPVPFDIEYGAEPVEEDPAPMLEEPEEVAACADVPALDGMVIIPVSVPVISLNPAVELDAVPAGVDPGDSVPPVAIELVATDPVAPAAVPLLGNGGRGTVPEKVSTDMVPPAPVTVDRDRLAACVAEDPDPEPADVLEAIPDIELNPINDVGYAAELEPDWPEEDDPGTAAVLALSEAVPEEEEPDASPEELIPEAVEAPRLDPVPGPEEPLAADEDKVLPVTAAVAENPEIIVLVWVTVIVLECGIVKDPLSELREAAEAAPDDRLAGPVADAPIIDEPDLKPVAELADLEDEPPAEDLAVVEPEESELVPDPGTGPADAEPAAEPVGPKPVELEPLITDPNEEAVTRPADAEPAADPVTGPVDAEPVDEEAVPNSAPGSVDADPAAEPADNDPVTEPVDDEPVRDPNAGSEVDPDDAELVAVEPGVS
ncbi:hypothetical protein DL764_000853 [Monosporascus ibericus]|uniref:Uncharacterized protein n=1 Tax=Monosporascus ibericus TaxID=155417 RepID=A0A4Q4TX19_9PEZI|nr:hypothetical protein DL764_000853 [Monosporascus ibericus]